MSRRTVLAASASFALAVGAFVSWNVSRRAREVESDEATARVPARRWAALRFPFLTASGEEGELSISGQVTLDGTPADGVKLSVLRRPAGTLARCLDTFEPRTHQCRGGSWVELIWDAVESGRAATVVSEGHFTGDFRVSGLAPGTYSLWFEAPRGTAVVESVEAGTSGLEVRLRPPLAIRGKVMDDEGAAIAGAALTALHSPTAHLTTTVAADDGTFAVPSLPSGGYFVTAAQTGLEPAMQWARLSVGSIEDVELRLRHTCRINGVVRRVSGPVAGCAVHVWTFRGKHETVSRSDGTFTLDEVPNRPSFVIAECQGERAQSEPLGCESPPDLTLWLQPVHWIRGRVLDESLRPVADAWVYARYHGATRCGNEGPYAYTDSEGRFEVGPFEPGFRDVQVGTAGMKTSERRFLVDGEDLDVELTLEPATHNPALRGRVVDVRGNPVPGAWISYRRGDEEGFDKSSAQGEFALDWERPGGVELKISSNALLDTSEKIDLPWTGVRTFTLADGFELRGTVLGADGSPARATVDVYTAPGEHASRVTRVETDDWGRFVATGLARGQYESSAHLRRNGHSTPYVRSDVPGAPVELRFPPELWIRGRVVNSDGKPVGDARVAVGPERSHGEPVGDENIHRTRRDGSFSFQVPNEPHIVFLTKLPGELVAPEQTVHAVPNGPEVLLSVDVPRIVGRVVDDQHHSIGSVFYVNEHRFESPAGRFALYVPRGRARLEIKSSYGDVVVSRSIDHGGDTDIGDVVLGTARPLEGVVREAASGAPVSGAEISLRRRATPEENEGDRIWSGTSDRDGRFMAPSVPLAPLDIKVSRVRYAPASMRVPQAGLVEIRLTPAVEPSAEE